MSPLGRLVASVALGGAVFLAWAQAASAHEIGTTRVAVRFQQDRAYDVEITTDATALAEKLAALSDRPLPAGVNVADLRAFLATSDDMFRRPFDSA